MDKHLHWMKEAINEAYKAQEKNEVPIGAVIVHNEKVIGRGYNMRETMQSPTAHAEMIAISEASQSLNAWRLLNCQLYVTLEPCPMCAGAIVQSRIKQVIYGAPDPKAGCAGTLMNLLQDSRFNHQTTIIHGIMEEECSQLLSQFFKKLRGRL